MMSDIGFLETEINQSDLKIQKLKAQNSVECIHIKQHSAKRTEPKKTETVVNFVKLNQNCSFFCKTEPKN